MNALVALAAAAVGPALHPLGDWRNWATQKDYPIDAIIAGQHGTANFALSIDANGLPRDCTITHSSGSKILDDQTCAVMLIRARFRPPVDRKGHSTTATYRQVIHWRMPFQTKAEKIVDRSFDALSSIGSTGEVLSCKLSGAGASRLAQDKGSCGPFGERGFLAYFLKQNYARARGTDVRLSVTFDGNPPPQLPKPADAYVVLGKAKLEIGRDGRMADCTSVTVMSAPGKTLDLCDFIRSDPPRYPAQTRARQATILLDLSAFNN